MAGVAEKVFTLIKETVEAEGVTLWDVRFVKEGASHYLRVFIDKPEGICIDDCTAVSHAIDPVIDEADPIDVSYYLEVCSPGLGRQLVREEHFTASVGKPVRIKLFKAIDGKKEIVGDLKKYDGTFTVVTENGEVTLQKSEVAKINLADDE